MKIKHQKEIVGKPNVLVNELGIEYGSYTNKPLNNFTIEDLVDLSEKYFIAEEENTDGLFSKLQDQLNIRTKRNNRAN